MNEDDQLKEYNLFISVLTLEQIANMLDEEISDLAVERPGHPGQYGFLLLPWYVRSEEQAAKTLSALLDRLGKIKSWPSGIIGGGGFIRRPRERYTGMMIKEEREGVGACVVSQ